MYEEFGLCRVSFFVVFLSFFLVVVDVVVCVGELCSGIFVSPSFVLLFLVGMFMFCSDANVTITVSRPFTAMGYATCFM